MRRRLLGAVLLLALAAPGQAAAQGQAAGGGNATGLGGPGTAAVPALAIGATIGAVRVELKGGPADPGQRSALEAAVRRAFGLSPGLPFDPVLAQAALGRVRGLPGVRDASFRLAVDNTTRSLTVTLRVAAEAGAPGGPSGILAGEGLDRFPTLWRDERSLVSFIANGGAGLFSEGNPWLGRPQAFTRGSPLVTTPPLGAGTGARASWGETYAEYGMGAATRILDSDVYAYGAVTGVAAISAGRDIFRDDTRSTNELSRAYAGVIWAPSDSDLRVNASFGKQPFTLDDGFLVARFTQRLNAGWLPGVYLSPRTAADQAALVNAHWGNWVFNGFWLEPNNSVAILPSTQLLGSALRYNFDTHSHAAVNAIYVPSSGTHYAVPNGPSPGGQQGLLTLAARGRWADPAILPGVWVEGALAHQSNENFPMSAWAGFAQLGYIARQLPWTPSLSYRYAAFSGDDPATARYERFDTLYSGGLDEWLQGVTMGKLLTQGNRAVHRVRLNVSPWEGTNLTLDWYLNRALELNNLGANPALSQLASRDLGQEWQLVLRMPLNERLFFMGIAGVAQPGEALRAATGGGASNWTTLQAQLFWTF
ncbi:hypothetical protein DFH01_22305 [Falsiroseomonas bella]|uniref:Alginate export domain-containing protein n=1 Tax=Falsiroseomonas bella TaxID=2184016 RepID=A0A317FAK4_9PROT|nr:alginate export family protein [Falsiroseomonas bella]PWS35057.1 hypothetical protein DFH01_22305 [Falsiroseomonas bella]